MSATRKRISRRTPMRRRMRHTPARAARGRGRLVLMVALVIMAVLVILLRLAEFSGRGGRRPRPRIAPTTYSPGRAQASHRSI